eukprot:CAMPEP_0181408292 /NCGR_PEP_ID=MMETSP1110-20121109/6223_1 /TAXON_ID=174948 /ORGANISM="Symbiodinium sp., Strain CCMP421" /LENGTH=90 /DNA_ID=CAMNT_0023530753 /DNA_START=276 /DNA_END=548 /DNA_ORIENTATION=+
MTISGVCKFVRSLVRRPSADISDGHMRRAAFTRGSLNSKAAAAVQPPKDIPVKAQRFTSTRPAKRLSWPSVSFANESSKKSTSKGRSASI